MPWQTAGSAPRQATQRVTGAPIRMMHITGCDGAVHINLTLCCHNLILFTLCCLRRFPPPSPNAPARVVCLQVDPDDSSARVGMAWHPDGTLLAVAGRALLGGGVLTCRLEH